MGWPGQKLRLENAGQAGLVRRLAEPAGRVGRAGDQRRLERTRMGPGHDLLQDIHLGVGRPGQIKGELQQPRCFLSRGGSAETVVHADPQQYPVAIGPTRADSIATFRATADVGALLRAVT